MNSGVFRPFVLRFATAFVNFNFGWSSSHSHFEETFGTSAAVNAQSSSFRSQYFNMNLNTAHHGWSYGIDAGYERQPEPSLQSAVHAELEATWNRTSEEQYFGSMQVERRSARRATSALSTQRRSRIRLQRQYRYGQRTEIMPGVPDRARNQPGVCAQQGAALDFLQTYYRQYRDTLLTQALVGRIRDTRGSSAGSLSNSLVSGFSSFGGCAKGAADPAVYFRQDIAGLGVDYFGADMVAASHVGASLTTQAVLGFHRAILRSSDLRLDSRVLRTSSGASCRMLLPLQASLTMDYLIGSRSEILGNVLFLSGNNNRNFPAARR